MNKYDVAIIGGGQAGLCLGLQLKQSMSELRIVILEKNGHPLPAAAHKVGESIVEISCYYLKYMLGLQEELREEQPKFGLRFFFPFESNTDILDRFEVGGSHYLSVPAFHVDRGNFENNLARRCQAQGIDFLDNCQVKNIALGSAGADHRLKLTEAGEHRAINCTWLVDAAGRASLLKRQLHLKMQNRHNVNAAWFRVNHAFHIDEWCRDTKWTARVREPRRLSTNHFMGTGYWLWFIPLRDGRTSVGIVAEDRAHQFSEFSTLEKALTWIERHEPFCARQLRPHESKIIDFKKFKNYSYDIKQNYSRDRWCITGDAGLFIDPFYSPGGDFIGISNSFITELIRRQQVGEDNADLADEFDRIYKRLARIFLVVYHRQYELMGHARVMSVKIVWDFTMYWGCVAFLFCHKKLHDIGFMKKIDKLMGDFGYAAVLMQSFFRDWIKLDKEALSAGFLDYAGIEFLAELNHQLIARPDDRSDDEIYGQLATNLRLAQDIQEEIIARVTRNFPELRTAEPHVTTSHMEGVFETLKM